MDDRCLIDRRRSCRPWAGQAPCSPPDRGSTPSATRRSAAGRRARSSSRRAYAPTSTGACSAPSSSISGRAVYTGVYEPGSRLADAKGFRTDVVREVKELACRSPAIPAATSSPGYNWLDGVGPKAQRPTVLERAWNSLETNQFGTNDFIDWCRAVGTEPLLGMNFGTGTAEMAVAYVEVPATSIAARSGATCAGRTATSSRTTCATGAWATRWTATGRSASCRRASTAARRATSPSRCASSIPGCS